MTVPVAIATPRVNTIRHVAPRFLVNARKANPRSVTVRNSYQETRQEIILKSTIFGMIVLCDCAILGLVVRVSNAFSIHAAGKQWEDIGVSRWIAHHSSVPPMAWSFQS
jgi:hypothetical protein